MADQKYEFEDADAEKPAAPAPRPATGKVAKGDGAAPPIQAAGKVDYAFEESAEEPAPKKKSHAPAPAGGETSEATPNTGQPVVGGKSGGKGRAAAAPVDEAVDPDVKPGSRKDLWNCPHCGAGNKPGRETCRTCGKSPDDAVETPWFKKPAVIGGAVGGLVLLILIIAFSGGTDVSARPADADSIDSKARIGGSASGTHQVGGRDFTGRKRFSVVGVCLGAQASSTVDGTTTVVLLLGSAAKSPIPAEASVTFNGDITEVPSAPGKFIIVHLLGSGTEYHKGELMSITGDLCVSDGSSWGSTEYIVTPESVVVGH